MYIIVNHNKKLITLPQNNRPFPSIFFTEIMKKALQAETDEVVQA